MRRILLGAAAALSLAAALPFAADAQTLRIGLREDPDLLDPTLGSSYVGRIVYAGMCDKLFDLDTKLNIVPMLATGYRYEDPTHLLITLRQGVTFHDGEPFNAEAVKYKLTRDLTAKGSMRAGEINAIQSIEVVDPYTVRLVLKAPASPLLAQLTDRAGIMISPKATEAAGANFGLRPVCAGPFAFEQRVPQDRIVLKRYPGYWNPTAYHFDQVVYLPIPNSSVRLANLQAGSLDLVEYVVPTDMQAVERDPKLKLAIGDSLAYTGITINTGNGPAANTAIGQNALVRQAFELAIDKPALIQVVYNGLFNPTAQANPPSSPMYIPQVQSPARDVARAQALLKQAGVTLPVKVVVTATNGPEIQQAAEVVQAMTKEAGFDVTIKTMEFASSLQAAYGGDFQAYLIGWSGRSDADGNMWPMMHTGGTFNYGHYANPTVDALLDEARVYTDPAKRRDVYTKLWEIVRQDVPLVYLWNPKNIVGMKRNLTGFQQVPDGLIRLQGLAFTN
ncbi:ABC transporter substrate-binding protein [Limobrevibacterium gyesilva]|uniref:ABC transporter substrate-binding protein n=1 Tax=Limobrevibacterium gyesilva TaxID=2991712 RepID=A0AA41YME9_9PROT|nr:ABC transporter substrate-binding protein [Limobrevibacterium gyesilva]MCW3476184.1 ABC transporter substrate-binding protein [Limobrevibacterium gyesilva]